MPIIKNIIIYLISFLCVGCYTTPYVDSSGWVSGIKPDITVYGNINHEDYIYYYFKDNYQINEVFNSSDPSTKTNDLVIEFTSESGWEEVPESTIYRAFELGDSIYVNSETKGGYSLPKTTTYYVGLRARSDDYVPFHDRTIDFYWLRSNQLIEGYLLCTKPCSTFENKFEIELQSLSLNNGQKAFFREGKLFALVDLKEKKGIVVDSSFGITMYAAMSFLLPPNNENLLFSHTQLPNMAPSTVWQIMHNDLVPDKESAIFE